MLKLLGAKDFELTSDGCVMHILYGKSTEEVDLIRLRSIDTLRNGLLFSTITLHTNRGRRTLRWIGKRQAQQLHRWLLYHYYRAIAPNIRQSAARIREILNRGYLRQSRIAEARSIAAPYVSPQPNPPYRGLVAPEDIKDFELIDEISAWSQSAIERERAQYVENQSKLYNKFFANIESKPLTEAQRKACITDEDNNLVLAGAGTGKTSTMIGRAGYLVESGQAEPHQILLLAFANKAAGEMRERLLSRLGDTGIVASTFHKLGKEIIALVERAQPSISPLAEDDVLLAKHVDQWFSQHMKSEKFRQLVLDYFAYYLYPDDNPFQFKSEGEYYDFLFANEIRTLKGEKVKSVGECLIANHLLRLGIDYLYEAKYEYPTVDTRFRQYQPDFYLPEHDIYIEHLGIDRNGNTAPYIDRERYNKGIEWKRQVHVEHSTRLIETFYYEQQEGILLQALESKLQTQGVCFSPLSTEAMLNTLQEFGAVNAFSALLAKMLRQFKANYYDQKRLDAAIQHSTNPLQVRAALELLQPIFQDYQAYLAQSRSIDFDDMIGKAIKYVSDGLYNPAWTYILVDEFQDMSEPRARLITALRDAVPDCSLFCVGDDWQAIYRFAGSDLSYTTAFAASFGATHVSALDKTFRFNDSICEVSSRFVQSNPNQIKKNLSTLTKVKRPAVSLLRANSSRSDAVPYDPRLGDALTSIDAISKSRASVYILSRFGFNLPNDQQMRQLRKNFPRLEISGLTMHAAKGKEADFVVIVGLEKGKHGFPSQKVTHPLLDALLPRAEDFPNAEERRIFYVALTRARIRAYLLTDMAIASEFVIELVSRKYPLELDEFPTSLTQRLFHLVNCSDCETGTLVPREGKSGRFYGCSHYPLCTNTESGCSHCGNPLTRKERYKVCINPDCSSWLPMCPFCGGTMRIRKGPFGDFWGCENYRADQDNSCRHTEKNIPFPRKALEETRRNTV